MPRQQTNTADYFPHIAKPGKTISILEAKFGNDGYAALFKILELLTASEGHAYNCATKKQWEFLVGRLLVDERRAKAIISLIAEIGILDSDLWRRSKILWCQGLLDNLKQVYQKRHRPVPERPPLVTENGGYARVSVPETGPMPPVPNTSGTQSIAEQSIAKHSRAEQSDAVTGTDLGGAVSAQPGQDLEQVIYDRIGWKKRLSRLDWDKVLALKSRHGPNEFFAACDRLHGGVTNIPAYLESILEPKPEGNSSATYKRGNTRNRTLGPVDIQRSLDVAESLAHSRAEPKGTPQGDHEDHRSGGSGEAPA